MYKFYCVRDVLSRKNLLMMYTSLIESVLRYCITTWGGAFSTTIQNLQTTQNTLLKIIFRKDRLFSTQLLYQETKLLNIRQIYTYQCILRVYLKQKQFSRNTLNTRAGTNLNKNLYFFSKWLTQRSFLYYGPKTFNLLPMAIKQINKVSKFKKDIKTFITEHSQLFRIF